MKESEDRLYRLVRGYAQGILSEVELNELRSYFMESLDDRELDEAIDALWHDIDDDHTDLYPVDKESIYRRIQNDVRISDDFRKPRFGITQYAAAAVVLLLIAGAWLFLRPLSDEHNMISGILAEQMQIKPGGSKALLTLADGSTIDLDQTAVGVVSEQGGFRLRKTETGQVLYERIRSSISDTIHHNTITTPVGGEFKVILPDGTAVWLNAASSLRYPVQFDDKFREVELIGEGYFEVNKQSYDNGKAKPFFVKTKNQRVEVLGTEFNVNDYGSVTSTTLVEGSVRVYSGFNDQEIVLKPGQQSALSEHGTIRVAMVDPMYAIAWKKGYFAFDNTPIKEVMNTLSRWYDFEVAYENISPDIVFAGTISRFEDVEKLLKTIELTGSVKFNIEGRRVTVMK